MIAQNTSTTQTQLPTWQVDEGLAPFALGEQDARDGMNFSPSSYYGRYAQMRQYTDGFLSVSPDDRSALVMVAMWDLDDEAEAQLTFPWRR